ncbi:hypothetical protein [Georgenia muralis]
MALNIEARRLPWAPSPCSSRLGRRGGIGRRAALAVVLAVVVLDVEGAAGCRGRLVLGVVAQLVVGGREDVALMAAVATPGKSAGESEPRADRQPGGGPYSEGRQRNGHGRDDEPGDLDGSERVDLHLFVALEEHERRPRASPLSAPMAVPIATIIPAWAGHRPRQNLRPLVAYQRSVA